MRMVHRQFPLDLQHCTLNPQVSVMVQLRSFLFRVHDDDDFDVLHLMPDVIIGSCCRYSGHGGWHQSSSAYSCCAYQSTYHTRVTEKKKETGEEET